MKLKYTILNLTYSLNEYKRLINLSLGGIKNIPVIDKGEAIGIVTSDGVIKTTCGELIVEVQLWKPFCELQSVGFGAQRINDSDIWKIVSIEILE